MTITAQTNVNGLTFAGSGGQEYVLAACSGFWSKINTATGVYTTYKTPNSYTAYRIVSDGAFVFVSDYTFGHGETFNRIFKYDLSTGALVDTWASGVGLNTIMYDGNYIWTAGDDLNVNIHDKKTGKILCTLAGAGQSDLVFDGSSVWSVSAGTEGNGYSGMVRKISMMKPVIPPAITPVLAGSRTSTPVPQ